MTHDQPAPFVPAEIDILVYWMRGREDVRQAKEAGKPRPWTADPLLRVYRWCNVRRLDDRVSRWLFDHWYVNQRGHNAGVDLGTAVLARLVNWPDSLEEIMDDTGRGTPRSILKERAARGDKIFTGAYVVPGVPGMNKVDSACDVVDAVNREAVNVWKPDSMRSTWRALCKFDGLGSFLAGQVVADLAHLRAGQDWTDRDTWAPLGPGSARGINRLLGRPKDKAIPQTEFERLLPHLATIVRPLVEDIWTDRRLQAMDLQNCLCEFDKYRRLTLGEGKVRARYDGAAETRTLL